MLLAEIRHALRRLKASPGFTTAALLTLAMGIAVTATMFTVLNATVLAPVREAGGSNRVTIFRTSKQSQELALSPGLVDDIRRQNTSLEAVDSFVWAGANLSEPGQTPLRLSSLVVSGGYFREIGATPLLGRPIVPADDQPGAPKVAVLGERFWRERFGADPSVVGRVVHIDSIPTTIVGVMPSVAEHRLYFGVVDLWMPEDYSPETWTTRDGAWMQILGTLKPGVTLAQLQADLGGIARRTARDHPKTDAGFGLRPALWVDVIVDAVSAHVSWLCMGLAAFVLMIACANLANLQLTRAASRLYEHALCTALGASRLRLLRRFVIENLVLALFGGALGVLLAVWASRAIGANIIIMDKPGVDLPVDFRVLLFTVGASTLTGVLCALAPAWLASRTDVNSALRQGSRGAVAGTGRSRLRQSMIVAELALALLLLTGAAYIVGAMHRLTRLDFGWKPEGMVAANLNLPFIPKYQAEGAVRAFIRDLEDRLHGLPGAQHASVSATLPITGFWQQFRVRAEAGAAPEPGREPSVYCNPVTADYFATVGLRIVQGRPVEEADRETTTPVAVINRAMAEALWPGKNPIGRRFADAAPADTTWITVVGVADNVHAVFDVVRPPATTFQVYRPITQVPEATAHYLAISVRGTQPGAAVGREILRAAAAVDPEVPVYALHTATEASELVVHSFRLIGRILSAFAAVGLVLAAVGLYGVIAYLVAQRTPEIGIRMALGATVRDVLWLVMGQGLRLAVIGTALGLLLSLGLARVLSHALPSLPSGGVPGVAAVAALLLAVALLATWLPARRAARISPSQALRSE